MWAFYKDCQIHFKNEVVINLSQAFVCLFHQINMFIMTIINMFLQHEKKIKCFKKISYSQLSHFLYNMSIPSSAYLERDALTKKSLCHYSSSVILSLSYFLICVLIILSSNNYVLLLREIPLICCLLFSWSVVSNFLRPHGLQHARLLFSPSPSPRVCSNSCPLSQ